MRRRWGRAIFAGLGVLAALAAGLYGWARHELEASIAAMKAAAPEGVAIEVGGERLAVPAGRAVLTDITITDRRPAVPRRLAIDRLALGGAGLIRPSRDVVPEAVAEGLTARRGDATTTTAERAVMQDIDLSAWAAAGDGPNAVAGLFGQPLFSRLTVAEVSGDAPWGQWAMGRLRLHEPRIEAGRMRALTWTLSDIVVRPDGGRPLPAGAVRELAPETLRGDLTFRASLRGPQGRDGIAIRNFRLAVAEQGTLAGELVLAGLDAQQVLARPDKPVAERAQAVALEALTLHYGDRGLAGRVLAHLAEARGQDRRAYVDDLITLTKGRLGDTQATESLATFLRQREALTLRLAPDEPVGLMGAALGFMIDPRAVLDRLGLAVSNDGPPEATGTG